MCVCVYVRSVQFVCRRLVYYKMALLCVQDEESVIICFDSGCKQRHILSWSLYIDMEGKWLYTESLVTLAQSWVTIKDLAIKDTSIAMNDTTVAILLLLL